jgi:hypothetical protein
VLARLDDNDPLYRALMDLALQQFESDATLVMESPKQLTEPERLWHAGRASAMGAYMVGVQRWKEGARADEEARRKQRQARKSE